MQRLQLLHLSTSIRKDFLPIGAINLCRSTLQRRSTVDTRAGDNFGGVDLVHLDKEAADVHFRNGDFLPDAVFFSRRRRDQVDAAAAVDELVPQRRGVDVGAMIDRQGARDKSFRHYGASQHAAAVIVDHYDVAVDDTSWRSVARMDPTRLVHVAVRPTYLGNFADPVNIVALNVESKSRMV